MNSMAELPSWLSIVRLDDRRYQLTDTSVASIGFCLGVFPCREAAESIAAKIAQSRVFRPASSQMKSTAQKHDSWVKPSVTQTYHRESVVRPAQL